MRTLPVPAEPESVSVIAPISNVSVPLPSLAVWSFVTVSLKVSTSMLSPAAASEASPTSVPVKVTALDHVPAPVRV